MTDPLLVTVVAYLHITSAIGWLGASIFFVAVLGPGLRSLTPAASLEFMAKVGTKSTRYFIGISSATLLFGLILLYLKLDGDFTLLWRTTYGETLTVGFSLALVAYLEAAIVTGPSFARASKLAAELIKNPVQGPPTELAALMKKGGMSAVIGTTILVVAAAFMVAAGFPF